MVIFDQKAKLVEPLTGIVYTDDRAQDLEKSK